MGTNNVDMQNKNVW